MTVFNTSYIPSLFNLSGCTHQLSASVAKISVFVALLFCAAQAHAMKPPELVVQHTIDAIVNNIQVNRAQYESNNGALFDMVERTLVPSLHVSRMANLILGKDVARSATKAQRDAFAKEFKVNLMRQYATLLLGVTGEEKVTYEPLNMKPGADKVVVNAKMISSEGEVYKVKLYMSNRKDSQWRAYNISAGGINFIQEFRDTFGDLIAKKGIDAVIEDLRVKNSQ